MNLTMNVDKYGHATVVIPIPSAVVQDIMSRGERGELPDSGEIWDHDAGVWMSFHNPREGEYWGVGPDGLSIFRYLNSPDPLDNTLPPALTLDDELAIVRLARTVLNPYMGELRRTK